MVGQSILNDSPKQYKLFLGCLLDVVRKPLFLKIPHTGSITQCQAKPSPRMEIRSIVYEEICNTTKEFNECDNSLKQKSEECVWEWALSVWKEHKTGSG